MANDSLINQTNLVNAEQEKLKLMQERQKLMDRQWQISKELVAGSKNARWWSYQPNWWPLNWIYWMADRRLGNEWDEISNRLLEINRRLDEINKQNNSTTITWPESPDKGWINNSWSKGWSVWWSKWTSRWWSKWVWNANAVRQPETPSYVDPNWQRHYWMSQEEFDNSMAMYAKDNEIYNARHAKVWNSDTTADELFTNALAKYKNDPDSFSDSQKDALWNAWVKLWYWNNEEASQPTQTTTQSTTNYTSRYWWNSQPLASQMWWRYWEGSDLDKRTQWWQVTIPFSF